MCIASKPRPLRKLNIKIYIRNTLYSRRNTNYFIEGKMKGFAYKLGNDINTDFVISGRYKFFIQDPKELAKHIFEDIDPNFYSKLKPGASFIVGGTNFGMGSSREQAPIVIKEAGILAVFAKSFARIFYRNSFNIGLLLVECDTDKIDDKDELELDIKGKKLINLTKNKEILIKPIPVLTQKLLKEGGVINYLKKHGSLDGIT